MTFANKVRSEISLNIKNDYKNRLYFMYGLLLCTKKNENFNIITTEDKDTKDIIKSFFKKRFNYDINILKRKNKYNLSFKDKFQYEEVEKFFARKNMNLNDENINYDAFKNESQYKNFVIGSFMACGTVSDPLKGYHIEFFADSNELSFSIHEFLKKLNFHFNITSRKNDVSSVYSRDSSIVEDILTYMGAFVSSTSIMTVKIDKSLKNDINRTVNFETANLDRTLNASVGQIIDINYIIEKNAVDSLERNLKEMIDIRLANPYLSLKDLGNIFEPPLSRSAVNHMIQKLRKHADKLRKEKEGNSD